MDRKIRKMADAVGFATKADQMDKVMQRIEEITDKALLRDENKVNWRVAISPHDDYTYVGHLYPQILQNITAKTVILVGVGHTVHMKKLGLADYLLFDSHTQWEGPYGNVEISSLREQIINELPKDVYQVHDEMQAIEHSVEAIVPFLQYYNRDIEIVSIIVPYMTYERMEQVAKPLGEAIGKAVQKNNWEWGKDYAIVISTDAVHYGDEDWGDSNFGFFGVDKAGYEQAVKYEHSIIEECLKGEITPAKVKTFTEHTVQKEDHREYKWTWCGRYSVPLGLLTSYYLQECLSVKQLKGKLVSYGTSIDGRKRIPVDDLGMGVTAPAKSRHWVGYVSVGYE